MKAFVTGGTGLLGNNLVRLLLERGWEVKALARSSKKAEMMFDGLDVQIVQGDLLDIESWAHQMNGSDVLFHTAAYFRETFRNGDHWDNLEKINVTNTIRLFELAEQYEVGKVIHISTNATIRKRNNGEISDESDHMNPDETLNLYGKSKVIADLEIKKFMEEHHIPIVTIMPAWMFGPSDAAPTGSGQFVLNFLDQKFPGSFPSGIDVVDVRDVANAMIQAAKKSPSGEKYIVTAHYTSLGELFEILQHVSGVSAPTKKFPISMVYLSTWFTQKIASLRNKEVDMSLDELRVMTEMKRTSGDKAIRDLNLTFRPLEETLRATVEWYRSNGAKVKESITA
ncbi:NAD-dependent epimerase/dehydratase family protein [Shimazuella kribbensis]|uniref:NAD-dependent epimerase/dehydratase family protein n=1 Tax=Shimazuella kribbensis TaxID=139808 RepID=UPI00040FB7DB|nr:NAD-dependent epimerase/dehydratase family protein [Shimazuella kribbensis]